MLLVRRRHWLAVSLTCSAFLLFLVLGRNSPPPTLSGQDVRQASPYRGLSSEMTHQAQTFIQSAKESLQHIRVLSGIAEKSSRERAPSALQQTSRNESKHISDDASSHVSSQSIPVRNAVQTDNTRPGSDVSGRASSLAVTSERSDATKRISGNRITVEETRTPEDNNPVASSNSTKKDSNVPDHNSVYSSSGSLLEMTITDIGTVPVEQNFSSQHALVESTKRKKVSDKTPVMTTVKKVLSPKEQMVRSYPQLIHAGVSAARYLVSRDYQKFPGDMNFRPGFPVEKKQRRNILILTTYRSGSTFLGDIFNAYPGTFYSFEPLHELLSKLHFEDGPKKPDVLKLLKDIMNCDMKDQHSYFEYVRNYTFLLSHNTRYWQACSINRALCFDPKFYNQVCEVMPVNLIKTVRLGAQPVEDLMEDTTLDLRVIHLVRDPRGTFHSRLQLNWCKLAVCSDPEVVCNNLLEDLGHAERLQAKYPDRFLLVRYEDLGTRPNEMTNLIIDFVGLTYTDSVKNFVAKHTILDEKKNFVSEKALRINPKSKKKKRKPNAYSTFRDSKTTTFAWRQHFSYSTVTRIQQYCEAPIKLLNFRLFKSEEELRDEDLSVLLPD